jgi:fused-like protein
MLNLTSKTELSPKGLISMLTVIHDTISNQENRTYMMKLFKNCLQLLCSLLRDNQLLSVKEWPSYSGGGSAAACMITLHVLRIFNLPFNFTNFEKETEQIAADMAKADIVHLVLNALRYLTDENIPIAFSLISKLVFTAECSKNFAN